MFDIDRSIRRLWRAAGAGGVSPRAQRKACKFQMSSKLQWKNRHRVGAVILFGAHIGQIERFLSDSILHRIGYTSTRLIK